MILNGVHVSATCRSVKQTRPQSFYQTSPSPGALRPNDKCFSYFISQPRCVPNEAKPLMPCALLCLHLMPCALGLIVNGLLSCFNGQPQCVPNEPQPLCLRPYALHITPCPCALCPNRKWLCFSGQTQCVPALVPYALCLMPYCKIMVMVFQRPAPVCTRQALVSNVLCPMPCASCPNGECLWCFSGQPRRVPDQSQSRHVHWDAVAHGDRLQPHDPWGTIHATDTRHR